MKIFAFGLFFFLVGCADVVEPQPEISNDYGKEFTDEERAKGKHCFDGGWSNDQVSNANAQVIRDMLPLTNFSHKNTYISPTIETNDMSITIWFHANDENGELLDMVAVAPFDVDDCRYGEFRISRE